MDEKQNFTKGMIVTIPDILTYTKASYGISEPMKDLIGTSQEIEKLIEDDNFYIKRWLWDKRDFKISEASVQTPEKRLPVLPIREQPIPKIKDSKISESSRKVLIKDLISS